MDEIDTKSKKAIEENSKKSTKKDEKTIIVDNKKETFDIFSLLAENTNNIVIKLNKLKKFGITDKMIVNLYTDQSSSVENKNTALQTLEVVYRNIIRGINERPNGIVLDFSGHRNIKESLEQSRAYGIDCDYIFMEGQSPKKVEFLSKSEIVDKLWSKSSNESKEQTINYAMKSFGSINNLFSNGNRNNELKDTDLHDIGLNNKDIALMEEKKDYVGIKSLTDFSFIKNAFDIYKEVIRSNMSNQIMDKDSLENLKKLKNSKYYTEVLNEDGNVDVNKVVHFYKNWKANENIVTSFEYLKNYNKIITQMDSKYDVNLLDSTNKRDLVAVLARGFFTKDVSTKKMFFKVCDNLGIGTEEKDIINFANEHYGEPVNTKRDLLKIKQLREFNDKNVDSKLKTIKNSINFAYSTERRIVDSVLNSTDVFSLKNNDRDSSKVKAVALLYLQYDEDKSYYSDLKPSDFIERYMIKHKEQFGEYLKENDTGTLIIDKEKVMELNKLQGTKPKDLREFAKINAQTKLMKSQIDVNIPKRNTDKYKRKVEKFKGKISELTEKNEKISDKEMDKLFKKSVNLEIEDLESIKKLNSDRFEHNMSTENNKSTAFEKIRRGAITTAFSIGNIALMPIHYVKNIVQSKKALSEQSNLPVVKKEGILSKLAGIFKRKKPADTEQADSEGNCEKENNTNLSLFDQSIKVDKTPTINFNPNLSKTEENKQKEDSDRDSQEEFTYE